MFNHLAEGVRIAFDSLRTNKLRSALTILGVVIGVTTVMTMASIVEGIETQILNAVNTAAPNTFYVFRHFATSPVDPNNPPYEVRIRPILSEADVTAIRQVPEISYASLWVQVRARVEYRANARRPWRSGARTSATWRSPAEPWPGAASSPEPR